MQNNIKFPINKNIVWHSNSITRQDREILHKHYGIVVLFTGLSGSGKSTIANKLEYILYRKKISTYLIDGDNIRHGLCCDLGFSNTDRCENIRRIGEVSKILLEAGIVVLLSLIAPFSSERLKIRKMLPDNRFIEIFVDTPLDIREKRDPKGLYNKSRIGNLENFTGIDSVYQKPKYPEIHLNGTKSISSLVDKSLKIIIKYLAIKL